jgi:cystathionine beta-lyase/cystathionine gamma-synthase
LLTHRLQSGDHLILSSVLYAGAAEWTRTELPRRGVTCSAVDTSNLAAVAAAMKAHPNTRHVHVETPANPILKLSDVRAIADLAHAAGATLSVDSTISTPLGQRPLHQGADFVVHSLTKYVCGHGDAVGGAVIGAPAEMAALRQSQRILGGGVLSPFSAFLLLRGLESLGPRMRAHADGARKVEAWLAAHPRVRSVLWTGSERHPQRELAAKQMTGHSGLLSFTVKPNADGSGNGPQLARQLAERLRVVTYAVSLGSSKSLLFFVDTASLLTSSFHFASAAEAADYRSWAADGVFRLSVGLEDPEDIIADLEQALQ